MPLTLPEKLVYASLGSIAFGVFISLSFSALHHILLFAVGVLLLWGRFDRESACGPLRFKKNKSFYALAALTFVALLSILTNIPNLPNPLKNIASLKYFLFTLLAAHVYPLVMGPKQMSFSPKLLSRILNIFLASTALASLGGLIALYWGYHPFRMKPACHPSRACGMYGMYMTYGYGIGLVVVLQIGLLLYRDKVKGFLSLPLLYWSSVLNLAGLFFSFARGAWLGFLLALPFFFWKEQKKLFITTAFILLGMMVLAYNTLPQVRGLFTDRDRQSSVYQRIDQYRAAITVLKERPFLGLGYKNFEPQSRAIKKRYGIGNDHFQGHAHSNFFEHLASTGILGLLALLLFHFFWARESYRREDFWGRILFPFTLAVFISGQFQYTLGDGENMFLIANIYALSQIPFQAEITE